MRFFGSFAGFVPRRTPRPKSFRYKYLRHPFDDWQYFSVSAKDQDEANRSAIQRFTEMFNYHLTVMTTFHPV